MEAWRTIRSNLPQMNYIEMKEKLNEINLKTLSQNSFPEDTTNKDTISTENETTKKLEAPQWADKITSGAKITGAGLGAAVCGATALLLFPASIIGVLMFKAGSKSYIIQEEINNLDIKIQELENESSTLLKDYQNHTITLEDYKNKQTETENKREIITKKKQSLEKELKKMEDKGLTKKADNLILGGAALAFPVIVFGHCINLIQKERDKM